MMEISFKILVSQILLWMIQSDHKFAQVKTAQLSWHAQNCDLILLLLLKEEQYECWQEFDHESINRLYM